MDKPSKHRLLLTALLASAFGGFLLFMIEQSDLVGLATISEELHDPLKNHYIRLEFPKADSTIANPVLIAGKANCSKTAVQARIKDLRQMELAEVQLAPAGKASCDFSTKIRFKKPVAKSGFLEIYHLTKDGLEANKLIIPVRFDE